jgi:superfamily II DNA or RNA helicase
VQGNLDSLLSSLAPGGKDFERLCLWLLQNAPAYRSKLKRVWRWDDWPGRWGTDAGIDLVAETRDGELWAVQAKHYAPAYSIRKADVDSFLSESARAQFSFRLLIATTDHLGPTAKRTIAAQEKQVSVLLRTALTALNVEWPSSLEPLRPAKTTRPPTPRPYQRRAVAAVVDGLGKHDRGQLVMACGTGKTLVARFLHNALESRRTLLLVPSLSLVEQTLQEWLSVSNLDYLAVCSDETVVAKDHDAVIASTSELGVPVTTDPDEIAAFLRRRHPRVVFATYQSSPQIAEAQSRGAPAFDLAVCDEAHRCAGPTAGVFATVLDPSKIGARHRLFMTATPRYFTGRVKKEAKRADWEVASMDDEERFGPILHRLTFARAIEQDLLSDYQVVVVGVTESEAHDLAVRGTFVARDGEPLTDARTLARQIGLLRAMAKHDLHRVVSFHSRIDRASRFASSLLDTNDWLPPRRRASGEIWSDHVSGAMTSGERKVKLNRLRSVTGAERGVLTNARCLTEGVDVPALDGVAFIDPRRSQVDVVQAVGRAIRKAKDKTFGTIVIPVLVDAATDPEEALESGEFDRVWQIVRALRDHDEDLAEQLDELRRELGRRGSVGQRPRKIVLDVPVEIGGSFARAFDAKVVETTTASWQFWFGRLLHHIERGGTAAPPTKYVDETGFRVGGWVRSQRHLRRINALTPEQVELLEALPGWTWDTKEESWHQHIGALTAFVASKGRLPLRGETEEALWLNQMRRSYREAVLPPDRIATLEAIPGWSWHAHQTSWNDHFAALSSYAQREGHAVPLVDCVEDGVSIGKWAVKQRHAYAKGRLSPERQARLESLPGWAWDANEARWYSHYDAMVSFASREGHARPKRRSVENGLKIGSWAGHQRRAYHQRQLSADRIARLEGLPGWTWEARSSRSKPRPSTSLPGRQA